MMHYKYICDVNTDNIINIVVISGKMFHIFASSKNHPESLINQ